MQENSAITLIQRLEEKLTGLLHQHKLLLEERATWDKKTKKLEAKIEQLEQEKAAKHSQIETLSVNAALESNNMDKTALKDYLDEVIVLLEKNISILK